MSALYMCVLEKGVLTCHGGDEEYCDVLQSTQQTRDGDELDQSTAGNPTTFLG